MIDYYKINEEIVSKIGDVNQKIPENTWRNSKNWEIVIAIFIFLFILFVLLALTFGTNFNFFCASPFVILSILSLFCLLFSALCQEWG